MDGVQGTDAQSIHKFFSHIEDLWRDFHEFP